MGASQTRTLGRLQRHVADLEADFQREIDRLKQDVNRRDHSIELLEGRVRELLRTIADHRERVMAAETERVAAQRALLRCRREHGWPDGQEHTIGYDPDEDPAVKQLEVNPQHGFRELVERMLAPV